RLLLRRVAGVHWLANRHSCRLPRPSAIPYDLLRPAVHAEQEFLRLPTDRVETIVLDHNADPLNGALHLGANAARADRDRVDHLLRKSMKQDRAHAFAARDYRMERLAPAHPVFLLRVTPTADDRLQRGRLIAGLFLSAAEASLRFRKRPLLRGDALPVAQTPGFRHALGRLLMRLLLHGEFGLDHAVSGCIHGIDQA